MRLDQLYTQEEIKAGFVENYCDNQPEVKTIIDRAMNLGLTARDIETLLSSAFERGMKEGI